MNPFQEVISLGCRCQTTEQIRRYFGDEKGTHIFDWMFSSFEGVIGAIDCDFSGIFAKDKLLVRGEGFTIDIPSVGLSLHHMFPRDKSTNLIILGEIDSSYPTVKNKLDYLVGKWRGTFDRRVLYVIEINPANDLRPKSDDFTVEITRLRTTLARARKNENFVLLAVAGPLLQHLVVGSIPNVVYMQLPLQEKVECWRENDRHWARAFKHVTALAEHERLI